MSETDHLRPVPGQLRPTPPPVAVPAGPAEAFAGLADRPVSEHVAVFEAAHDRLQRDLSTIDQL